QSILDDVIMTGTRVQTGVYNFTETVDTTTAVSTDDDVNVKVGEGWNLEARKNMLAHLRRFKELWDTCDIFVIEQQYYNTLTFGKGKSKKGKSTGANVDAIK